MIAEKMKPYVKNNSAIRMMFEEGNRLRAIYGADKVYDFSLGNPSVPAPECVKEAIIDLVNEVEPTVLHGYMSNAGFEDVRQTIAESLRSLGALPPVRRCRHLQVLRFQRDLQEVVFAACGRGISCTFFRKKYQKLPDGCLCLRRTG